MPLRRRLPSMRFVDALFRRSLDGTITESDLRLVAQWPVEDITLLFAASDRLRRHFHGHTVRPCCLLNIRSGNCPEDCAFCAQSIRSTAAIDKFDLVSPAVIKRRFREAIAMGMEFCVVSAGRRLSQRQIRTVAAALAAVGRPSHASLGILNEEDFSILRDAGVVCYNHNLETSRRHFSSICTTHSYDERLATVRRAKAAGMRVCCGGIFGMGETWDDRIALCQEISALQVDTIPLNFFHPIAGTRLPPPRESPLEFLKIVVLFRLAHPRATIKVCGGREYHLGMLQPLIFLAGANGYVSGHYLTTRGQGADADEKMIAALGLKAANAYADSANPLFRQPPL